MEMRAREGPKGSDWLGRDGRFYPTMEEARKARPVKLRLHHFVVSDGAFLNLWTSWWVRARNPKHALQVWMKTPDGGPVETTVHIYDYLSESPESPIVDGFVRLGDGNYARGSYTKEEQCEIYEKIRKGDWL